MMFYVFLSVVGLLVGAFGTIIGAGGGFLLMPALALLYPEDSAELLTSISLAVVCLNAISGSFAYAKMKRIDFKSGCLFAMAAIPGATIGAAATAFIPRHIFDALLGATMILAGGALFFQNPNRISRSHRPGDTDVHLTDRAGIEFSFSFNRTTGILISVLVGLISGLLGIGGGIIHVPAMVFLLNFPVAIATATSHFVLAIVAFAGTGVHIASGVFAHGIHRTIALSIGVIIGAQIGARLSHRVSGTVIIRSLSLALIFVGLRVLWQANL